MTQGGTSKVGYIGLGNMGAGIATRLARLGMQPTVFDLQKAAIEELVAEGALGAGSLEELVNATEIVIVCVDPVEAVRKVVMELVPLLREGQTVIMQSSVSPAVLHESAELVEATGAKFFDAPVSGSHLDRQNGTLAVLVGASEESTEKERSVLEAIGRPLYFGKLGGGEMAKLANNAMMSVTRHGVAEAMAFAAAYGLSEDDVRKAGAIGSGNSWVLENWEYFNEQTRNGFLLKVRGAQARTIIAAAEERGVRMHMLEAVRDHGLELDKARYRLLTGKDPEAAN